MATPNAYIVDARPSLRHAPTEDEQAALDLPLEHTMDARDELRAPYTIDLDRVPSRVLPATRSRGRAAHATPSHSREDDMLVAIGFGLVGSMCGLLVMLATGYGAV